MKFILMILTLIFLSACGKDNGNKRQEEQVIEPKPQPNGYLDTGTIKETELLNVSSIVPMSVSADQITLNSAVSVHDIGMRTTCSVSINPGEFWRYQIFANKLELEFPNGKKILLTPLNSFNGIYGTWIWLGKINETTIRKRFSFLPGKVVINQDCET